MNFVANRIRNSKIRYMQLDPFGYCNAKCWFCPVKYYPQPEEGSGVMSIELIEKIFADLTKEKNLPDGVVDRSFKTITLSHYNEILLYKHFDQLLELLRKYSFTCFVLSNGLSLSKQKVDLIKEYKDVVVHVGLNIPAFESGLWAKRTGFAEEQFTRLIQNLKYAEENFTYLRDQFQIGLNGIDTNPIQGGYVTLGFDFKSLNYNLDPRNGEHETQLQIAKKLFPKIKIIKTGLYDRAGTINHILTNKPYLQRISVGKKVIGCNNWGDRSTEWLNVNSAGNVFLCCNDYNFEYKFGDLNLQSIREVWLSDLHIQTVEKAYSEICTNCYSAKLN